MELRTWKEKGGIEDLEEGRRREEAERKKESRRSRRDLICNVAGDEE